MPRPKKIVQEESKISDVIEVNEFVEPVQQIEIEEVDFEPEPMPVLLNITEESAPSTFYKVYHLGNFVAEVKENSEELYVFLDANKNQLYANLEKLKIPTNNQEDLVLFNIPETDNRKYNSLAQYFQQNGLAPHPPRITDWLTYYKSKYPFVTDEEIVIQVFGPLDYSFEIVS